MKVTALGCKIFSVYFNFFASQYAYAWLVNYFRTLYSVVLMPDPLIMYQSYLNPCFNYCQEFKISINFYENRDRYQSFDG